MNTPVLPPDNPNAALKEVAVRGSVRAGKSAAQWPLLLLALAGVAVAVALGTWQLRRADLKEALASEIAAQNQLPALTDLSDLSGLRAAAAQPGVGPRADALSAPERRRFIHRRVQLQGTWLHAQTVFLDNRFMAGRPGFYVVTPLQLAGSQSVVWVQRGWVARDVQDRTRLPALAMPASQVTVPGRFIEGISRVYALGEGKDEANRTNTTTSAAASAPAAARASQIWQNLPTLNLSTEQRALPLAVLQTSPALVADLADSDGLIRDWPSVDAGVAKHYGYAFQWFALCGLIIVLYVWFQILSPRRRNPRV